MNSSSKSQSNLSKVVGLRYVPGEGVPTVVLQAEGVWAEQVLSSRDPLRGPAVIKDAALVERLMQLPNSAPISSDLFAPVAAILVHVLAVAAAHKGK